MTDHVIKTTNPQAMVLIWNYENRVTADGGENVNKIAEIILNSASLRSISTAKSKGKPAGTFEIRLAPTHNWIGRITPGSWCAIMMSQDEFIPQTSNNAPDKANEKTFKMLCRIHDVRVVASVDQSTGARMTEYVITGEDWGSVFDTILYIDPIAQNNNFDKLSEVGHAARLLFDKQILDWLDDKNASLPTSSQVVRALIDLWGAPLADLQDAINASEALGTGSNPLEPALNISSNSQFLLPAPVAKYMNLGGIGALSAVNLAKSITLCHGILKSKNVYSGDTDEARGFPNPNSLTGANSFWQLLIANSNSILNEMFTDIRWNGSSPTLSIYKRIRPFAYRTIFTGSDEPGVSSNISKFQNLKSTSIPLEDVLAINAGTNWKDKKNFIEVRSQPSSVKINFDSALKTQSQSLDLKAYERDGFKPMIKTAEYIPHIDGALEPLKAVQWKHLLREWHFNLHNVLNGSVSIIGQNQYISVGDNIKIPAVALGSGVFNSGQVGKNVDNTYLLAHVESISHKFSVNDTGGRSFMSSIRFVRGVIVDNNDNVLGGGSASLFAGIPFALPNPASGALDPDATDAGNSAKKNKSVFGTSTENDPDISKLKGK